MDGLCEARLDVMRLVGEVATYQSGCARDEALDRLYAEVSGWERVLEAALGDVASEPAATRADGLSRAHDACQALVVAVDAWGARARTVNPDGRDTGAWVQGALCVIGWRIERLLAGAS